MALTPGAYIKHRRTAALLSEADVAAKLATEPRLAEHVRVEWIKQIEADVQPASFNTVVALRCAFPFDLEILERLAAISMGAQLAPPRLCIVCACSDRDFCLVGDDACGWATPDLCSAHGITAALTAPATPERTL